MACCSSVAGDDDSPAPDGSTKPKRQRACNDKFSVKEMCDALSPFLEMSKETVGDLSRHDESVEKSKVLDFTMYPHKNKRGTAGCIQISFGLSFLGADIFVLKMRELRCWC